MSADPRTESSALIAGLLAHVQRRRWLGETRGPAAAPLPVPEARPPTEETRRDAPRATKRAEAPPVEIVPAKPPARAVKAEPPTLRVARDCGDLDALRAAVADCRACALCETRTQTVFSDGDGSAGVLFIGEAPGQNEDEQGVPFVGRAGQLLTDIIQKGMGLRREDVTIANVLKCRPPDNRDPTLEEKGLCTPFLDRQIELIDPKVIVTLGLHASQHLLKSTSSMGRLRGRVHVLGRRKVVATYHPAFLLRSPGMKKACWQDIQLAMRELGLATPGEG